MENSNQLRHHKQVKEINMKINVEIKKSSSASSWNDVKVVLKEPGHLQFRRFALHDRELFDAEAIKNGHKDWMTDEIVNHIIEASKI